jgi:hypothetical protein
MFAGDNIPMDVALDPKGESLEPFRKAARKGAA